MLTSQEVAELYVELGQKKANYSVLKLILLAMFGGMMIGLASVGANTVSATVDNPSIAKLLSGLVFPTGLAMVAICGAELLSSSCLVILSVFSSKLSYAKLFTYWFWVFIGNILGSLVIAVIMYLSGQFSFFDNQIALTTIKVAIKKVSLTPLEAVSLGILCNLLVCLAILMAVAGKSLADKVAAVYLPIMLFILCGFEHCVANMYYIPAGILALQNPEYKALAIEKGLHIDKLSIMSFLFNNLLWVIVGNIIGGTVIIAGMYYLLYLRKQHK